MVKLIICNWHEYVIQINITLMEKHAVFSVLQILTDSSKPFLKSFCYVSQLPSVHPTVSLSYMFGHIMEIVERGKKKVALEGSSCNLFRGLCGSRTKSWLSEKMKFSKQSLYCTVEYCICKCFVCLVGLFLFVCLFLILFWILQIFWKFSRKV